MKERHTMSLNCFTSFSFLTPISLINLLLQQWVKEIVSLSFFFLQDPMAEIMKMNALSSANARLELYRYTDPMLCRLAKNCSV